MNLYEMFEDQQEPTFIDALRDFLPIAVKQLKLTSLPKIKLERNLEDTHVPTFGRFENDDRIISLDIENRHPVDILRTLAHELTHYAQGERGELDDESWRTGSPEENEANAMAGVVMRVFNTEHPQYLKMKPISLPAPQIDEGFMRNAALVATLAGVLAAGSVQAEPTAAQQALGIARVINKMKGYGPEAAQAEAYQELRNLIRAIGGSDTNHSKIYPLIKDMVKTPGELPTEPEQLPPLTSTSEPVNEKWSEKYKSSIDCDNPKGFSQRAHCQGRKKSNESTADDINKLFGNMYDPMVAALQRVALLAMQGRHNEAQSHLSRALRDINPQAQKKVIDAVNAIKPVTINGKVADSSTLDKSKAHQDWIVNTFIPWVQTTVNQKTVQENFADGKKPGRKGLAKRSGVNCKASVTQLRKVAKNSTGEKRRMAHWCANMKSGRSKG